jgi:dTDP-3-amino-3,4,6-trideoxy-alpha-D-glucose transaminase
VHVAAERKSGFMAHLKERGILSGEHYPLTISDQRALADVSFGVIGELTRAPEHCRTEVSLPIHPYLTDDEVAQVVDACNAWGP